MVGHGRVDLQWCEHCQSEHEHPCPSPEEIWGTLGPDGVRTGGLVHSERALATRIAVCPERTAVRDFEELPVSDLRHWYHDD